MSDLLLGPRVVRVGVTGLARAGKTAFLTSVAASLFAHGSGLANLPALSRALGGRALRVTLAPSGASGVPRFEYPRHLAALAADPPGWPDRTDTVSLLALDLSIERAGLAAMLPPARLRLELLDYPGEWLLDLPLIGQDFTAWSEATLRRLAGPEAAPYTAAFLAFARGLSARSVPARSAPARSANEALAEAGQALYRTALLRLRDEAHLSFLQPGRFLMPPPGPIPPWMAFFPLAAEGQLADLLRTRFDAYRAAARDSLMAPLFGTVDRLVVLADLLSALHAGAAAYADTAAALATVARALGGAAPVVDLGAVLRALALPDRLLPRALGGGGVRRVAFAATKADHVAERQRGNLAALVGALTADGASLPTASCGTPANTARRGAFTSAVAHAAFAIAAIRCTEDFVWTLEGRPVSAVRGRVLGEDRLTRSYPGEVPDTPPDAAFFAYPFLALPDFEPRRLPADGAAGTASLGLDALLAFLLADVL